MKLFPAILLALLGALAVAGGWYYGLLPTTAPERAAEAPAQLAFPGLAGRLQTAARVEIVYQNKTLPIGLKDGVWGLADRDFFPAQQGRVHALLIGLTELRLVEPRTTDPAQFARLGVDDPHAPASIADLVRVLDGSGAPLAELIVGHTRARMQGDLPEAVYVRRPNENQAWLAEGKLGVDADPQQWMVRDIVDIGHDRIASVRVLHGPEAAPTETLELAREGDKPVLKSPPTHPDLEDYRLDDVFRALEHMVLVDEKPAAQVPGERQGQSVFTTTDGLHVTATLNRDGKNIWLRLAAAGDGAAKAEAEKLAAQSGPWAYQVGESYDKSILPALADLAKAPAPAAAPASPMPALVPPPAPAAPSPAPAPSP